MAKQQPRTIRKKKPNSPQSPTDGATHEEIRRAVKILPLLRRAAEHYAVLNRLQDKLADLVWDQKRDETGNSAMNAVLEWFNEAKPATKVRPASLNDALALLRYETQEETHARFNETDVQKQAKT